MIINDERDRRLIHGVGVLRRRWHLILGGAMACAAVTLVISLLLPKVYRAKTDILISESKISTVTREDIWQQSAFLPTFKAFVDNDTVISQAINKLGLDRPPYNLTLDRFRRKDYLDVEIPKSTHLLELTVEFPDPRIAADLANDIAQRAVTFNRQMSAADTLATSDFLKKRLDEVTASYAQKTQRRLEIQQKAKIDDLQKQLSILLTEKALLSNQLEQLHLALAEDTNRSRSLKQAIAEEPRTVEVKKSVSADPTLDRVAEKLDPNALSLSMTEESLNSAREKAQQDLIMTDASIAGGNAGIQTAEAHLKEVNQEISELLPRITTLQGQLDEADNEYKLAYEAVKNATREYQEASVTVSAKSAEMKQVTPALAPERPVRPKILLNTILGFLLGSILFAGISRAIENFKETRATQPLALVEKEHVPAQMG